MQLASKGALGFNDDVEEAFEQLRTADDRAEKAWASAPRVDDVTREAEACVAAHDTEAWLAKAHEIMLGDDGSKDWERDSHADLLGDAEKLSQQRQTVAERLDLELAAASGDHSDIGSGGEGASSGAAVTAAGAAGVAGAPAFGNAGGPVTCKQCGDTLEYAAVADHECTGSNRQLQVPKADSDSSAAAAAITCPYYDEGRGQVLAGMHHDGYDPEAAERCVAGVVKRPQKNDIDGIRVKVAASARSTLVFVTNRTGATLKLTVKSAEAGDWLEKIAEPPREIAPFEQVVFANVGRNMFGMGRSGCTGQVVYEPVSGIIGGGEGGGRRKSSVSALNRVSGNNQGSAAAAAAAAAAATTGGGGGRYNTPARRRDSFALNWDNPLITGPSGRTAKAQIIDSSGRPFAGASAFEVEVDGYDQAENN
eukprot:COSAG05_NODE_1529_length_4623_cov_45.328912_1_plen_422_part_10